MKNINVTIVITKHQNKSNVINGLKNAPLKTHLQVQHVRIKFECYHVDHKANQRCNLKSYKGSILTCTTSP